MSHTHIFVTTAQWSCNLIKHLIFQGFLGGGGCKLLGHMILIHLHFSLFSLSGVRQFLVVSYKIIVVILDSKGMTFVPAFYENNDQLLVCFGI